MSSRWVPDGDGSTRLPLAREVAPGVAVLTAATWFYLSHFHDLFPLIEFRSCLEFPSAGALHLLRDMLLREELYTRSLSLSFIVASGAVCGIDIGCLNAVNYIPVGGAVLLLYVLLRLLECERWLSALCAFTWAFSLVVAELMSWQATHNDKLGACFSLAVLCVAVPVVRTDGLRGGTRVLLSGLLFVLVVCAYSTKETAFFLGPSLVILAVVGGRSGGPGFAQRAVTLAVPLSWIAYHQIRFLLLLGADPDFQSGRVTAGSIPDNARAYATLLLNFRSYEPWMRFVFSFSGALLALTFGVVVRDVVRRHPDWKSRYASLDGLRIAAWLWISYLLSLAVIIRARDVSFFRTAIPSVLFYAAAVLTLRELVRVVPVRFRALTGALLAIGCSGGLLYAFKSSFELYDGILARSRTYQESFPIFRAFIPPTFVGRIYLVLEDARWDATMFTGDDDIRDIHPYIYRTLLSDRAFDAQFRNMNASAFRALPTREAQAFYVVYDMDMRMVQIDQGARTVYSAPRRN